jgi:hypothetical protein
MVMFYGYPVKGLLRRWCNRVQAKDHPPAQTHSLNRLIQVHGHQELGVASRFGEPVLEQLDRLDGIQVA